MNLISYQTYKKRTSISNILSDGFRLCGEDYGYSLFKSINPKDVAKILIKEVFTNEESEKMIFVYVPHYYRGRNNLQDRIEVYYRKIK